MTEKTLKEKIAESKKRSKIQQEIDNYTDAIKKETRFASFHHYQIEKLEGQLEELNNVSKN